MQVLHQETLPKPELDAAVAGQHQRPLAGGHLTRGCEKGRVIGRPRGGLTSKLQATVSDDHSPDHRPPTWSASRRALQRATTAPGLPASSYARPSHRSRQRRRRHAVVGYRAQLPTRRPRKSPSAARCGPSAVPVHAGSIKSRAISSRSNTSNGSASVSTGATASFLAPSTSLPSMTLLSQCERRSAC